MGELFVDAGSVLERKAWVKEGLVDAKTLSFWSPYTGMSSENVIYQKNMETAEKGNTLIFDYDGNLSGRAIKGLEQAFGRGENKKKYSSSQVLEMYRIPVNNGTDFKDKAIDNLASREHSDSRTKLGDLFMKIKDQTIFDAFQGLYSAATHCLKYDFSATNMAYQDLVEIELRLKTGTGFTVGAPGTTDAAADRAPLQPFIVRTKEGRLEKYWLMVVDSHVAANLKGNATDNQGLVPLMKQADLRGTANMIFTGVLGQIGRLLIVEAPSFFGETTGTLGLEANSLMEAGMRAYDAGNSAWEGQSAFVTAEYSRCLILGKGAGQLAMGKSPDYKFKQSQDFDVTSESALEVYMGLQKTVLTLEKGQDFSRPIAGNDFSCIALDIKI